MMPSNMPRPFDAEHSDETPEANELARLRARVEELENNLKCLEHELEADISKLQAKLSEIADKVELARDTLDTVPLCDGCMQEDSDPCGCWIGELQAILNKP